MGELTSSYAGTQTKTCDTDRANVAVVSPLFTQLPMETAALSNRKPAAKSQRQRVLRELRGWAGTEPAVRPRHRPFSLEEAVALAQGGLVEVGAHAVSHPALPVAA